uniref:U3 small nucleolar RNA-associated protein 6 n=1 Tax=Plectus sambesii TaxID=2011161 RepID=A0A914XLG8_9BILA
MGEFVEQSLEELLPVYEQLERVQLFKPNEVHGGDPKLWQDAANWEFTVNRSAVNARALLQQALRRFPQNRHLYLTLFDIEVNYVRRLKKREEFLKKGIDREQKKKQKTSGIDGLESDDDEDETKGDNVDFDPVPDAVMQLKLAEVIINEGLRTVKDDHRSELLLEFWRSARKCGEVAQRLEVELFERLWTEKDHCEHAWLAKVERDAGDDPYAVYDEAVELLPTEKMIRFYADFCERRVSNDPFAVVKLRKALSLLRENGWASIADCTRLVDLLDDGTSDDDRIATLESALKAHPNSVELWLALLRIKVADASLSRKEIQKVFNQATTAVSAEAVLPVYQLAVDWTLATAPEKVRRLFEQSFTTLVAVSAPMKTSYLRYLATTGVDDYRIEYRRLAKTRPTSAAFHRCAIELEMSRRPHPDVQWLKEAHENAASECGDLPDVWLAYCEFCMAHRPELTSAVYQRATLRLTGHAAEHFNLGWTRLLQRSSDDLALPASSTRND